MSIAPLPTPLQHLGGRRFSFYPAIRNIEHNEWLYRRATWSECVVANMRTGEELCVPRIFLGDVSYSDDGDMVVALSRELESRAGAVIPRERAVIQFPAPAKTESLGSGAEAFRLLTYPSRHYAVVLLGPDNNAARYIGVIDPHGRVLDSVRLSDGRSSAVLLSSGLAAGLR
jgi:hypothetical protein